jgi:phenylalanyl-tRNA synthetase beta chain
MSNSLTKKDYYAGLKSFPEEKLVNILNPLSNELNVMRQTLLFNGLEAITRNINHKNQNLRLFEYGRIYSLKSGNTAKFENFTEVSAFGLFITGNSIEQSWTADDKASSFYELKAYYLNLIRYAGADLHLFDAGPIRDHDDIFSGGLQYRHNDSIVIKAGSVNQAILKSFDIENEVYFAEINWDYLLSLADEKNAFSELPKFPEVRRDLALLIDENIGYSSIEKIAFETERKLLKKVNLFDYYKGENIPKGKKSYAVSFVLQDPGKTLTDREIEKIMSRLTESFKKNLNAELR